MKKTTTILILSVLFLAVVQLTTSCQTTRHIERESVTERDSVSYSQIDSIRKAILDSISTFQKTMLVDSFVQKSVLTDSVDRERITTYVLNADGDTIKTKEVNNTFIMRTRNDQTEHITSLTDSIECQKTRIAELESVLMMTTEKYHSLTDSLSVYKEKKFEPNPVQKFKLNTWVYLFIWVCATAIYFGYRINKKLKL